MNEIEKSRPTVIMLCDLRRLPRERQIHRDMLTFRPRSTLTGHLFANFLLSDGSTADTVDAPPRPLHFLNNNMAPQPSRKGKKAWRKNIDIADVEESLEELRKEEMAG